MRWTQVLTRAKVILPALLLLTPFLFSVAANLRLERTITYSESAADRLDTVFAGMRRFSGRLALREDLAPPVDVADVLSLQQRLEETPPPDPMVQEYFVATGKYLVGMGYSFVRPDLFYRGRVSAPEDFADLRRKVEQSAFAMSLLRTDPRDVIPATLLIAYDLPRIGPGAHAKTVALIDVSDVVRDAAAAGYRIATTDDEIRFIGDVTPDAQRILIESEVLPLSYVTVYSSRLFGTPLYQVLLLSLGLALLLTGGDILAFTRRIARIDSRELISYRQLRTAHGHPAATLREYLRYTAFGFTRSGPAFNRLVFRWLKHGEVSNNDLDMIVLALRLPADATYAAAYFERGALRRRRSDGVSIRLVVESGDESVAIVSTGHLDDAAYRESIGRCFDGRVGVGNRSRQATQLPTSYMEGKEAFSRLADRTTRSPIIFFADLPTIRWESFYFPIDVESKLLHSIRVGNSESYVAILEDLYDRNRRSHSPSERMWGAFIHNVQCALLKLLPEIKYRDNREGLLIKERILEIGESPRASDSVICLCNRMAQLFSSSRESRQSELFDKLKRYIDEFYRDQSLSLKLMAAKFDVSESHISRLIKDRLGLPYHQYVEQLRLDYAARQIVETRYTLSEIARKSGYTNLNTFRKAFVRRFSLSPQAYRQRRTMHAGRPASDA